MTLVVDASVIVAALVDEGEVGDWADRTMRGQSLAAPQHVMAEATNVLRLAEIRGDLSRETASLGYADLLTLHIHLFAFAPFAERVWELRGNLTPYDAWYVAVAETIAADLVTLDQRLARSPGPRCRFVTPADGNARRR